jgi:hypothetical protein
VGNFVFASLLLIALAFCSAAGAAELEGPALPPPPAQAHVDFISEHMDYDKASTTLHLKDSVRLRESTWTIKADELWLNTKSGGGHARGSLFMEDGSSALLSDGGEFNFREHTALLSNASSAHGDWRFHGKSLRLGLGRRLYYKGADFTGCDYDIKKPHYHFHASRVTIVPNKRLVAYNTFFYMGRIPLFYTPVLYKSLKPDHLLRFRVQPGYDRRNGGFARSTLITDHGPYFTSRLFIDYYGAQGLVTEGKYKRDYYGGLGLGTGGELHRRKGDNSRWDLYGYRIRETKDGDPRWALLGNAYQALPGSFSIQNRLQMQSDAQFNDHYARSRALRVTPELINSGALVYQRPFATARLSYSRTQVSEQSNQIFVRGARRDESLGKYFTRTQESFSRLDVQTRSFTLWRLPWLNTFTGFADKTFVNGRPYIEKTAGGEWEMTRTVPLLRKLSLTPKAAYSETFLNIFSRTDRFGYTPIVYDTYVGRYRLAPNLRLGTPIGDWDAAYTYQRRLRPGTHLNDNDAFDYGVEVNSLGLQDSLRPTRRILLRVSSGYEFRRFRDRVVEYRRRVAPVVSDVTYTPWSMLSMSLRDEYNIVDRHQAVLAHVVVGYEDGTYLSNGLSYNKASPRQYFTNTEFGWVNSSGTLRLAGALRAITESAGAMTRLHGYYPFEKQLFVSKNWHDFSGRAQWRLRPNGVEEISIYFELKLPAAERDAKVRKDWEAEWFPGRNQKGGDTDRP